jgi:hypothetical protein
VDQLGEAASIVDAMPDGELIRILHCAVWLAVAETNNDELHDASRHLARALTLTRRTGQTYLVAGVHLQDAAHRLMLGRLADAARILDDAQDAAVLSGSDTFLIAAIARRSRVAALQGDADLALRLGREVVALTETRKDTFAGIAAEALAFAHLHTGDPAACTALLGAGPSRFAMPAPSRNVWYEMLAQAAADQGQVEAAAMWADHAASEVALWWTPRRSGLADLARSHALLTVDPVAAAAHACTAAHTFAAADDRLLTGRAHLHAASALAASGDPAAAARELERARELLDACGAVLFDAPLRRVASTAPATVTLVSRP